MAVVTKCTQGTTSALGELFSIQQGNPELLADPYEVAYKCLMKEGDIGSTFSLDDFKNAMRSSKAEETPFEDRVPFDPYNDRAQTCFLGANMTIGKASK